jgi:tetratricopeptide (TPR) repeat protein
LIKDWDFNWQGDYRYASPVFLPKGTTLVMNWTFDNSVENVRNPNQPPRPVRHGSQTTNEMAELWFQALACNPSERNIFERDFYAHLGNLVIDYNESLVVEDPGNAEAHTKAGRAEFYFGQVQKALNHFRAAIKADPKFDKAYYELGFVCLRLNNLAEAQQAFENVVRLNPDDYEAEGSLGVIFLRNRDLDNAELHFRAALRINPDDQIAGKYLERILQAKATSKK